MNKEQLVLFCRMCNSVGLPLDIQMAEVILAIKDLTEEKGQSATMQDLDNIILKYTVPKEQSNEESNYLKDERV